MLQVFYSRVTPQKLCHTNCRLPDLKANMVTSSSQRCGDPANYNPITQKDPLETAELLKQNKQNHMNTETLQHTAKQAEQSPGVEP